LDLMRPCRPPIQQEASMAQNQNPNPNQNQNQKDQQQGGKDSQRKDSPQRDERRDGGRDQQSR
jgi:hypothetical protein